MNDQMVTTDLEPKIDLAVWHGYSIEAERTAQALVIADDVDDGIAVDTLSSIKQRMKEAEEFRVATVAPWNKLLDRVNAMFKPINISFKTAETEIKRKHGEYLAKKEQIRLTEERRRQEEYQRKVAEEQARVVEENRKRIEEARRLQAEENARAEAEKRQAAAIVPPPVLEPKIIIPPPVILAESTVRGNVGAASSSKVWDFEVVNIHEVYKSHPELVTLEIKKGMTKEFIKTTQNIPGLKIFQVFKTSAR